MLVLGAVAGLFFFEKARRRQPRRKRIPPRPSPLCVHSAYSFTISHTFSSTFLSVYLAMYLSIGFARESGLSNCWLLACWALLPALESAAGALPPGCLALENCSRKLWSKMPGSVMLCSVLLRSALLYFAQGHAQIQIPVKGPLLWPMRSSKWKSHTYRSTLMSSTWPGL